MGLRDAMPRTAAFVDELRAAFGEQTVTSWLKGENGAWFCAEENGERWCTPGRVCLSCAEGRNGKPG